MKRLFDLLMALTALALLSPILILVGIVTWLWDLHSPLYMGQRVARGGGIFRMIKFRSMVVSGDQTDVVSTADDDRRITAIGRFLRRFKIDELPQLWNIVRAEMSLVGPRPNVAREVALYSEEEKALLSVRPGVTDFASIVFSDEGEILTGSENPDRDYNLMIRPWKSRLGLHYIETRSMRVDLELILLTVLSALSRPPALRGVQRILERTGATDDLVRIAGRGEVLLPTPPPGVAEADWEKHLRPA